ncbi:hypothetical protein NE237_026434 [Protea cynaroides]|uniref:Uncharacterized protein n=1 Tax=Protea cynaroides TaxID=273540 RepID=A0A9Q0H486_9MAGN|nr:hypothetical protein NE237_026434 [Protea cynaroides]
MAKLSSLVSLKFLRRTPQVRAMAAYCTFMGEEVLHCSWFNSMEKTLGSLEDDVFL